MPIINYLADLYHEENLIIILPKVGKWSLIENGGEWDKFAWECIASVGLCFQ